MNLQVHALQYLHITLMPVLYNGGHAGCYESDLSELCHKCETYGKG